ncbi:DUF2335 domain-containing protein [Thalassotalea atypica]|uniref:DUF2335 domain-containing protein n=1 Tax=Thalassotalea atypica TaxID=2054316 RepID=UPI002573EEB4|nr:DUF2335 domain-containing protein [Thalassotalea atypica]
MDIFLSYTHSNSEYAKKITQDLSNAGLSVWFDKEQLGVGENLTDSITKAIREASTYLVLVSTDTVTSPWFSTELATALATKEHFPERKIIPVITDADVELPPFLSQFLAIDLSSEEKYKHYLPKLLEALKRESGPIPPPNILKEYENIVPGMAERMLLMAEKEQLNRWEKAKVEKHGKAFSLSLLAALLGVVFIAAMTAFGQNIFSDDIFKYFTGILIGALIPSVFGYLIDKPESKPKSLQGDKHD